MSFLWDNNNNVYHIRNDLLINVPSVVEKLSHLSQLCGGNYNACGVYNTCQSYTLVHLKKKSQITSLHNVEKNAKKIDAMLIAVVINLNDDTWAEIYDVCVNPQTRGKGIAKNLIESLISIHPINKMWLGIRIDNPYFDHALKLYTRFGFQNPQLTRSTPAGAQIPFNIISLTWIRGMKFDYNETVHSAYQIYNKLVVCMTKFVISKKLGDHLRKYLSMDREYAGSLEVVGKIGDTVQLGYDINTEVVGNDPPKYATNVPSQNRFFFHTHPSVCYDVHKCYLGWPSGTDMMSSAMYYKNEYSLLNFVVTKEGIYSVNLGSDFMRILDSLDEKFDENILSGIYHSIYYRFTDLEKYRASPINHDVNEINIHSINVTHQIYLNIANNYNMQNLIEDFSTVNFDLAIKIRNKIYGNTDPIRTDSIFSVGFRSWMDFDNMGYVDGIILNRDQRECPEPVTLVI